MRIPNALAAVVVLALGLLSADLLAQPARALPTSIYAITDNGDMLFYKYDGAADGSPNWSIQAKKIGNGWNFKQVFTGRRR